MQYKGIEVVKDNRSTITVCKIIVKFSQSGFVAYTIKEEVRHIAHCTIRNYYIHAEATSDRLDHCKWPVPSWTRNQSCHNLISMT